MTQDMHSALHAEPAGQHDAESGGYRLQWTEPMKPNNDCNYNHTIAQTAFGRILISWKGWKDFPSFLVEEHPLEDFQFHCGDDLESTKEAAEAAFFKAISEVTASQVPRVRGHDDLKG